jgi:hypothetical protein
MSFYNTTNAIEQQLFSVFSRFRRQFFETPFSAGQHKSLHKNIVNKSQIQAESIDMKK